MVRQHTFMIVAPLDPAQIAPVRALLAQLNHAPGVINPHNQLVPFARFPRLHFARFVVLDDPGKTDLAELGLDLPPAPVLLAFLGDCDGSNEALLDEMVALAGPGLIQIFSHCQGFATTTPLGSWLRAHNVAPTVQYGNWPGRTVQQIREEAALRSALRSYLDNMPGAMSPTEIRQLLQRQVQENGPALSPVTPPGFLDRLPLYLEAAIALLVGLALLPLLILALPFYLIILRRLETSDRPLTPRPGAAHSAALSAIEDHDVSNQFSAYGTVKPGLFRSLTLRVALFIVGLGAALLYPGGRLARVGSIHFARWVYLDGGKRLLFASNYDGSLESYMDDFINKVAFGLNLVFSNGVGYPRTRYLMLDGAKDEQAFKSYIRRHQLVTEAWYKAYPGLTAHDLGTNARVRQGLEATHLDAAQLRRWLGEI